MNNKQRYINAFQQAHPSYEVSVNGPNKRGQYTVALNGDRGDLRLTEADIREATNLFSNTGELSLRNSFPDLRHRVERTARLV